MQNKPNCYECKYRRDLPGDAHSRCVHPAVKGALADPFNEIMAIFASVGRAPLTIDQKAVDELDIHADYHGIRSGWFNWPYNFDPVWLKTCKGFEAKQASESPTND